MGYDTHEHTASVGQGCVVCEGCDAWNCDCRDVLRQMESEGCFRCGAGD